MDSKGSGSVFGSMMVAFMVFLVLYFMVAVLSNFWSTSTNGCAHDENGTLVNCTLNDNQYASFNQTDDYAAKTINAGSLAPIILIGLLFSIVIVGIVKS